MPDSSVFVITFSEVVEFGSLALILLAAGVFLVYDWATKKKTD